MLLRNVKDIDLLYAYQAGTRKSSVWIKNVIIILIIEIILLIISSVSILAFNSSIERQNITIQSKIDSYANIHKQMSEYNRTKNAYNEKQYVYDEVRKDNDLTLKAVETLESIMPKQMRILSFSVNQKGLSFIVEYKNEDNLAEFLNKLQREECFTNISIDGITSADNSKRTSINAGIVRK